MRSLGKPALFLGAVLLAGILTSVPWASAQESSAPQAPTVEGDIIDFDFKWQEPGANQVDAGSTVTFTNRGERPHTITDRAGTFDELVMPGQSVSITLTIPGNVAFFCKIRAAAPGSPRGMDGLIQVQPTHPAMVNRIQTVDAARFGAKRGFDPATMTVSAGSTVLMANIGGEPHTLTADNGAFDTGRVAPGAENGRFAGANATFTVADPGTYPFHCSVHPEMRGVLTVQGPGREDLVAVESTSPLVQEGRPQAEATDTNAQPLPGLPGGTYTTVTLVAVGSVLLLAAGAVTIRNRRRASRAGRR
jgi:plastocyanin